MSQSLIINSVKYWCRIAEGWAFSKNKTNLIIYSSSFLSKHESISVWMWMFELKIMFRMKPWTWLFSPFNNSSSQSTRRSVQCEFDNVTSLLPHVVHHLLDPGGLCFHQLQQQKHLISPVLYFDMPECMLITEGIVSESLPSGFHLHPGFLLSNRT